MKHWWRLETVWNLNTSTCLHRLHRFCKSSEKSPNRSNSRNLIRHWSSLGSIFDSRRSNNLNRMKKSTKEEESLSKDITLGSINQEDDENPCWHPLTDSYDELRLSVTLPTGQSFRWSRVGEEENAGVWCGVIRHYVIHLKQKEHDKERVFFYYDDNLSNDPNDDNSSNGNEKQEIKTILEDYFRLNKYRLSDLFATWRGDHKLKDKLPVHKINQLGLNMLQDFAKLCEPFVGLRLTRPDPVETLFSFICSQNNNIGRITKMVEGLCRSYGTAIKSQNVPISLRSNSRSYYAFPTLPQLLKVKESELRDLGFGYICKSAEQLNEKGEAWLLSLREDSADINKCREQLTQLMGIGNKVADCISLFSLDKLDAIPVDTHVWKIAQRYNIASTKGQKGPTNTNQYDLVNEFFKEHFGETCGWAHTVLFAAELAQFKPKEKTKISRQKSKTIKEVKEEEAEESDEEITVSKRKRKSSSDQEKPSNGVEGEGAPRRRSKQNTK